MRTFSDILTYTLIAVLGIVAFFQWKKINELENFFNGKISALMQANALANTTPVTDANSSAKQNVTMGEMWDALQQKIGQVKVELDLK